jgi:hypothetical protein
MDYGYGYARGEARGERREARVCYSYVDHTFCRALCRLLTARVVLPWIPESVFRVWSRAGRWTLDAGRWTLDEIVITSERDEAQKSATVSLNKQ